MGKCSNSSSNYRVDLLYIPFSRFFFLAHVSFPCHLLQYGPDYCTVVFMLILCLTLVCSLSLSSPSAFVHSHSHVPCVSCITLVNSWCTSVYIKQGGQKRKWVLGCIWGMFLTEKGTSFWPCLWHGVKFTAGLFRNTL